MVYRPVRLETKLGNVDPRQFREVPQRQHPVGLEHVLLFVQPQLRRDHPAV